MDFSLNYDN
jgi:alpha-tubulin suppressor-like RCC1 family protein